MTFQIAILLALLAGMVYFFLTEKIPVDLTAFCGLVILIFAGFVTPQEAFAGFASSAVITMLAIFIVGAALLHTGVADIVGRRFYAVVGGEETVLVISLMLVAGMLSAFMNNIAATAVMMPAVASIARHSRIPPSRLFMPLAFGAILGGTSTQVGTPPNILAGEMLRERGMEPFSLFDFTPIGLLLLGIGTLFMVTVGRKLLPHREHPAGQTEGKDLASVYQLHERLFSLRIPEDSALAGKTLREARLGTALNLQVAAILRRGKRILAPRGEAALEGGDVLLVEGNKEDIEQLLRMQGVEVLQVTPEDLPELTGGVGGVRAELAPGSPLEGRTLPQLRFRQRFGLVVVGIRRGTEVLRDQLGLVVLRSGDQILALGRRQRLEEFRKLPDFVIHEIGLPAVQSLLKYLFLIHIPKGSPLAGKTLGSSRIGELVGLTIGGVIRGNETLLGASPDGELLAGDKLLVASEPERILNLLELGDVRLATEAPEAELESDRVGVVEAVVAPRSSAAGRTLGGLDFRQRYGLQVLSIWRQGDPIREHLGATPLQTGDALLLQGPWHKLRQIAANPAYVVLSETAQAPRRFHRAWASVTGLALMIGLVVSGSQPINVAAFTAATFVILFGAIRMEEAYRAIEWRAIFLVAAVLPVGAAMESTGAAQLIADTVLRIAGPFGPYAVLGSLIVLSSLLSQGLDGAPAVVLLTPVALQAAAGLDISPYPVMMGISLAASAAFMTPFSHKANLLVMGAGGYRSSDYLKVGTPLTVLLLALMILLVPVFFPF